MTEEATTATPHRTEGLGTDPVTALPEKMATGPTAAIFAEIRKVMQIPLLTSIWRTLVSIDRGLPTVWAATKPIYLSGQPDAALGRLSRADIFPVPAPLGADQLADASMDAEELRAALGIIDAYTRSNSLNMMALSGLVLSPVGPSPADSIPATAPVLPNPPELLEKFEIAPDVWMRLERVNRLGAGANSRGVATLWRHLAHYPGLLRLINHAFAPLQADETIDRAIQEVFEESQAEGARLAHLRGDISAIPDLAIEMVTTYVDGPSGVARMVTIGHGLAQWLRRSAPAG
ncbi:MAG: hypothetical protein OXH60_13930 [Rhodospirillales bacterium]|nr:hypothetical protein [Rhodospirillales bacterium]